MNIFKCNSDKCHCQRCTVAKLETRVERVEDRLDNEIGIRQADHRRAERERERERFLASTKTEADLHRARGRLLREKQEALGVPMSEREYYSWTRKCNWRWVRISSEYWRKQRTDTGAFIDGVFENVSFKPDGWRAFHATRGSTPFFASDGFVPEGSVTGRFSATDAEMHKQLENIPAWAAGAPVWRDINPPTDGDDLVLNPIQLSVLLFRASHPAGISYPTGEGLRGQTILSVLRELDHKGLIRRSGGVSGYELTPRAKVFIDALCGLPLPVQQEAPWVMPKD